MALPPPHFQLTRADRPLREERRLVRHPRARAHSYSYRRGLSLVGVRLAASQYHSASDEVLVRACRAADADAWEVLVARYRRLVYASPCAPAWTRTSRVRSFSASSRCS